MLATFFSCILDDETENTYHYALMATVVSGGDYPFFKTDVGEVLECSNVVKNDSVFNPGDRYYLSFSMEETVSSDAYLFPIVLNSSLKVKTRNFVTIEKDSADIYNNKQLGSVFDSWISGNYINMVFYAYTPLTSISTFELVRFKKYESNTEQDTVPTIFFEFRHNTEGINSIPTMNLYSYELSPLISEFPVAKEFEINLTWFSVYGNQTYVYIYTPYDPSESLFSSMKKAAIPNNTRTAKINFPYGL